MSTLIGADGRPVSSDHSPPLNRERHCVGCGCTSGGACVVAGRPCAWALLIEDDAGICSACIGIAARLTPILEAVCAEARLGRGEEPQPYDARNWLLNLLEAG